MYLVEVLAIEGVDVTGGNYTSIFKRHFKQRIDILPHRQERNKNSGKIDASKERIEQFSLTE